MLSSARFYPASIGISDKLVYSKKCKQEYLEATLRKMDEIEITKVQTAPILKETAHAYVTLIDLDIQFNYIFL
jgi:hypothetical protein